MPITNLFPQPHPTQPQVPLNRLAIEEFFIRYGSAIEQAASIEIGLKAFAELMAAGDVTAYLTAPLPLQKLRIDDVYKWLAVRAAAGDMKPMQLLGLLTEVVAEEYARQVAERLAQQAPQS